MKKWFILTALIASIATGQSGPPGIDSPTKRDVSVPVVHGVRKTPPDDAKRTWGDKVIGIFSVKRDEAGHRTAEDNVLSASEKETPHVTLVQPPAAPLESEYLKEIASVLLIPVSKDDTPGDIAFKIKQCIVHAERYNGEVLSDKSFELAKSAIGIPSDAETFKAYQTFIKKIAGKKILVIGKEIP